MALKRLFGQEGGEEDGSSAPQRLQLREDAMRDVVAAQSMQRLLLKMEPFLRRVVQEEVQNVLCGYPQSAPRLSAKQIQAAVTRPYRLRFQNKLPDTLFTGSRIEAEGKIPVQIAIINTDLNDIITSGPLSTTKIEIFVLDGDFGGDGQEEWTEKEFSDSIVREREGKRPLLTGELIVTLNNGVGYLGDATFTDNSSWIRSRKFRLGARAFQSRCSEGRVHEAITEAFLVKDHRGELYKKHHPPALSDKVWRLEKIGKDGAFHKRLAESRINTVRDFLRFLVLDQDKLRSLLGSGMSNKIWEATVEHARECVLDDKLYSYSSGQGVVLLFDSIFQLIGATIDHIYHPVEGLTAPQKVLVNKLKEFAYKNPSYIKPHMIDTVSLREASMSLPRNPDLSATHLDEPATQLGFQHQPQVPSYQLLGDQSQLKEVFPAQVLNPVQCFGSFRTNSFDTRDFDLQFEDFPTGGLVGSIMTGEHLMAFNSEADIASASQLPMAWDQGNGMMQASRSYVTHLTGSGARVSSGNWVKLMAALKWMTISKRVSAKRARIEDLDYPIVGSSLCASAQGGDWLW